MKKIVFYILIFCANWVLAADIRTDFHDGMFEEDKLEDIAEKNSYPNTNLALAYKGISKTMLADYMYLPTSKLSYFNDGKADLEKAIKTQPNNPELRYLRLLVQLNAPFFLGYNNKVDADIKVLTQNLTKFKLSKYWKLKFIDNLIGTDELSDSQKSKMNNLKTSVK